MIINEMPTKTGLYNPENEHDACGIGAIVSIKGEKSHDVIKDCLKILTNLEHRGGTGAEDNTGDGAGILFQIPHKFFKSQNLGFEIGNEGNYAVAQLFISKNKVTREEGIKVFLNVLEKENLEFLGFREVPYNDSNLGKTAINAMPYIIQAFVKKPCNISSGIEFERKIYIARKLIEKEINKIKNPLFYFCSFSSKTIVYKGMLLSTQVRDFYLDLQNKKLESAIALVHSRFSTNTFPSWEKAHPNRFMIHNGEINTIKGNVDLIRAREVNFKSSVFSDRLKEVTPVIGKYSSDSAMFDNVLEFFYMAGRPLEESLMMMIPEPWDKDENISEEKKNFYKYYSTMVEPWDGPAAVVSTDGEKVIASLDRNGLRPSRYYLTSDGLLILSSETGALDIDESKVIEKNRLEPGKLLLIDTKLGRLISDEEIKSKISNVHDYKKWLDRLLSLDDIKLDNYKESYMSLNERMTKQKALNYKYDNIELGIFPMCKTGEEVLVAMGTDTPLSVLSKNSKPLSSYFKQKFAQVTNPPIDSLREEIVTSTRMYLGSEGNLIEPNEVNCHRVEIEHSVISNKDMAKIKTLNKHGFKVSTIDTIFEYNLESLEEALERIFLEADKLIDDGACILILSDKLMDELHVAIPSLLVTSAIHQHLVDGGRRTKVSIVVESADAKEIHDYACLLGFGATVINPYMVYEIINGLCVDKQLEISYDMAVENYIHGAMKGIVKIISKMGISTVQAYNCSRIFEIIGLSESVTKKYFSNTPSKIGGIDIDDINKEIVYNHQLGYSSFNLELESEGIHGLRNNKEEHLYNPITIYKLQYATKNDDYSVFKEFTKEIDSMTNNIRNLFDFVKGHEISLDEVESADKIVKRFKTGAMSYGSISQEAHECLAIAMNRIGGKSNTGEGGENKGRKERLANGDSKLSAIKQVASGRFGVTIDYLVSANEIQIKVAQGAKPGEGGQLPAPKVYPWVAEARHSTPGVTLISPPPHHDIYSIEDLAQLIYDLKNANKDALISVKLVSEDGVGTIAAGVAKAGANVILISGYDGGTGASPRTSIANVGMPFEIGLADVHQTLIMNNLRNRVMIETDGKLLTGKDLAVSALLGAEQFGFATAPLISMGCVMMRVCNLDSCPVGVATQNSELRKRFKGKPEYVVNFMYMIANELREYMAMLGFRTLDEMIGRSDLLCVKDSEIVKTKKLNLDAIINNKYVMNMTHVHFEKIKESNLETTIDHNLLLPLCKDAIDNEKKTNIDVEIKNINRSFGTILSSEITKKHGSIGLKEDTITINTYGNAGNSFGAFLTNGITLNVYGDANDYLGKGLCGGNIYVSLSDKSKLDSSKNIIAGNVILYGATKGKVYLDGIVGERFAVRNSGAIAISLGCGAHGCEYMTGGEVIILGPIGRNFAAGMSGGIAYIYDEDGSNLKNINRSLVNIYDLSISEEIDLKDKITDFVLKTNSEKAKDILNHFNIKKFFKVYPCDYEKMCDLEMKYYKEGLDKEGALLKAFYEKTGGAI